MKNIFFCIAVLGAALPVLSQTRIYVNSAATGANDGSSWTNAHTNLQAALLTAQAGDEVWVAEGIYYPTNTTDRSISFEPASGVRLYGGFAGVETSLAQRDWQVHPTVLSGDIGILGDSTDNSYNVVYLFEPDSTTLLDGFVLRHGTANVPNANSFSRLRSGGGLYIMGQDADAYPDIRNCVFVFNTARSFGGAVMVNGGGDGSVAPRFTNCHFEYNRAVGSGGGVARIGGSWIERGNDFADCIFLRNAAGFRGGGFYYLDSERADQLDIRGCTFQENSADDDGGGAYLAVGRTIPSGYSITKTVFRGNEADDGAAFVSFPQGLLYGTYLNIDSCEFTSNLFSTNGFPQQQAVIKMEMLGENGAKGYVKNCIFQENNNWPFIATMLLDNAETIFDNVIITNNLFANTLFSSSNPYSRTDIYNSVFSGNSFSNTICENGGDEVSYYNCIFEKNISAEGHYMINQNVDTLLLQNCTFANNDIGQAYTGGVLSNTIILSKNSTISNLKHGDQFFYTEGYAYISNCHFDSSFTCPSPWPSIICLNGNIFGIAPMFRDTAAGDYSLLPCSPLIDAGSNTSAGIPTDITGAPRIQGGTVDIGAYEAPLFAFAAVPTVIPGCEGQANGSISISTAHGCEPLDYFWQPGGPAGPTLNGLGPGAYQITVTDVQGRQITDTILMPSANPPTLQVSGSPISCFGAADAMLAVIPLTGQPPFTYLWSPTGTIDSMDISLGPGPVSVTVTDAWGCTATFAFDIPEPDTLQFTATVQNASSQQSPDGSIMVNVVIGGTAPYDYLWSPGGSTADMLNGLLPGFYTLTVTDERGCEAVWTFEVKAVSSTGGAEEITASLIVYPNPARGEATVRGEFESATPSLIEIYDTTGRLLRSELVSPLGDVWELPLNGLAAGGYVVYLKGENGDLIGFGKLIKL